MRFFKTASLLTFAFAGIWLFLCWDLMIETRDIRILLIAAVPSAPALLGLVGCVLYERFRAPDVIIRVALKPLPERFLLQEQRLEQRERLRKQLFDLNCEIETFNANLAPDERKAWRHRPGPYGK